MARSAVRAGCLPYRSSAAGPYSAAMDLETALAFAAGRRNAVLTTLRADGRPQQSVIFFVADGERFTISVTDGRAKTRNLRRDPRAALFVAGRRPVHLGEPRRHAWSSAPWPGARRRGGRPARGVLPPRPTASTRTGTPTAGPWSTTGASWPRSSPRRPPASCRTDQPAPCRTDEQAAGGRVPAAGGRVTLAPVRTVVHDGHGAPRSTRRRSRR